MILLRADPEDYARVVSRRRREAIAPVVGCVALATAIVVAEYRLMLIAFLMLTPAMVAIIDAVILARLARRMGACEVRLEGEWLALNARTRVRVDSVAQVRVRPDSLLIAERLPSGRFAGHLLPAKGEAQRPLMDVLRARGCTIKEDPRGVGVVMVVWVCVLANLMLPKFAGVLLLGALGYTVRGFVNGPGPGWEALACFGGVVLALTLKAVAHQVIGHIGAQANANKVR